MRRRGNCSPVTLASVVVGHVEPDDARPVGERPVLWLGYVLGIEGYVWRGLGKGNAALAVHDRALAVWNKGMTG